MVLLFSLHTQLTVLVRSNTIVHPIGPASHRHAPVCWRVDRVRVKPNLVGAGAHRQRPGAAHQHLMHLLHGDALCLCNLLQGKQKLAVGELAGTLCRAVSRWKKQ